NYVETFRREEIVWGNGCGEQYFKDWTSEILPLISGPAHEPVSEETANRVIEICAKYKTFFVSLYSNCTKYSLYMRHFDDNLNYIPEKEARIPGDWAAVRCVNRNCRHANAVGVAKGCVACEWELPLSVEEEEEVAMSVVKA
ncbi:hypothetical protein HDU76_011159, partial [Blyttiomyces sp. JEL0837]